MSGPNSTPPAQEPLISIRGLNHYFGEGDLRNQILHGIDLDILPGEIVILTGPSGSGKTTLLTLCGALRTVQEGSARILGKELQGASEASLGKLRTDVGVIFQAHNLVDALNATQNVALSLGLEAGLSRAERNRRAVAMLETVGLGGRLLHLPEQMSGGQKQRVAIARALVRNPKIVLADEPTASLDRKSGREVIELLRTLARSQGSAVLLVTHDNRILDVADRIVTLDDGRLVSFASAMAANAGNVLRAFSRLQSTGNLAGHVRSLSTKQFVEMLEHLTAEFRQYVQIFQIGSQDAVQELFDDVLEATTLKMIEVLSADRGTLFLLDTKAGMLRSRIATGEGDRRIEIEVPVTGSLAGQVVLTGKPLNLPDAYDSPHFNRSVDQQTGYRTRSMLCVPIFRVSEEIFAVAQFINQRDGKPFSTEDEENFAAFAEPLGIILENCLEMRSRMLEAKQS